MKNRADEFIKRFDRAAIHYVTTILVSMLTAVIVFKTAPTFLSYVESIRLNRQKVNRRWKMERRDLIYEMKKDVKGAAFISMTTLSKHLGRGKAYAKDVVAGLETIDDKYFIPDVVGRLMDRRKVGHKS